MRRNKAVFLLICLAVVTASVFVNHAVAEDTKQITCAGKVVDAEGQAIAGAKVSLYQREYNQATNIPESKLVSEVRTGGDGAFSFKVSAESDVFRYGYIVAEKAGLAVGFANWRMRQDQELQIKLGRAKELEGIIVDESDKPIPGVEVSIWSLVIGEGQGRQDLGWPVAAELLTSTTDQTGRFVFTNIPAEATADFIIKKSGMATINTYRRTGYANQKMSFAPGQKDIKLTLPVEARVEGTIVAKDTGTPVGGVSLIIMQEANRPLPGQSPVSTKKDGTFIVNALPDGSYQLQFVQSPQGPTEWVAEPVNVALEAGQAVTGVKMELCKGGMLEVHVTDAQTNQPIGKAHVNIHNQKTNQWIYGTSDDSGIAFVRLMPGPYQFSQIYKSGYTSEEPQEAFALEDGEIKRLSYQLPSQPKINGVVRDENGKPVQDVIMKICPMGGRDEIKSNVEGQFEISWNPRMWGPGPDERETVFCLVARHEKQNLAAAVEISEDTKTLDVKLQAGVTLIGKVVDTDGKGIPGAQVMVMLRVSNWGSPLKEEPVIADQNGAYEIKTIPAGNNYSISASARRYGQKDIDAHTDNAVNNRLEVETLVLPLANLSVSGKIVDTQGKAVSDVHVEGSGEGQPRPNTITDKQGNFTLEGLCKGTVYIRAEVMKDGKRLSAHVNTDAGASGISIVIREGNPASYYIRAKTYEQVIQSGDKVIAGVALDEAGSPVKGVPVGVCCIKRQREEGKFSWTYSSYSTLSDITDEQGRFAIELEEDAEYNLLFSPDNQAAIIIYDVPSGTKDLKVTLQEGGTVTGRLLRMEKGKKVPVPNAEVKIQQTDRRSYTHLGFDRDRTAITDSEGRFRFEHISTKVRPNESKSDKQWEYVPCVWEILYGDTSKTIAFYDGKTIEDFELVVKPKLTEAQSLAGGAMPGFDGIKIELSMDQSKDKAMLLCFFDMNQRPSRNAVIQLARRAEQLEMKGIVVVAIQVTNIAEDALNEWIKDQGIPFPVGIVQDDEEETRFTWGVKSLPWLILTDTRHMVVAEGFGLNELEEKIKSTTASSENSIQPISITGLVKDPQGQVLSNVRVTEFLTDKEYSTDAEGKFVCAYVPTDNVRYFFAVHKQRELVGVGQLAAGQRHVEINLVLAKMVSGIVVDPDGEPVAMAQVAPLHATCFHVFTDAQGKFDVGWDPEWVGGIKEFFLFARHQKRDLAALVYIMPEAKNVDMKLEPGLTLTGTITDPNDKPIAGATIGLTLHTTASAPGWGCQTPVGPTCSDDNGCYEFKSLPQKQEWIIDANADGYIERRVTTGVINTIVQREDAGQIILKKPVLSVSGIVVDSTGKPVANIRVGLQGEGQPERTTSTDAQGKFTLDKICIGSIEIWARLGNVLYGTVSARAGQENVKLTVAPIR